MEEESRCEEEHDGWEKLAEAQGSSLYSLREKSHCDAIKKGREESPFRNPRTLKESTQKKISGARGEANQRSQKHDFESAS